MSKIAVGVRVYDREFRNWATISQVRHSKFRVDWDDGTVGEIWWSEQDFTFDHPGDPRLPTGPVVTEMVQKTRIVPGTYGRLSVHLGETNPKNTYVAFTNINGNASSGQLLTADELDAAAAVLSALAKGLRDVG